MLDKLKIFFQTKNNLLTFIPQKCVPTPGIEPGPAGWEPAILTPRPCRIAWKVDQNIFSEFCFLFLCTTYQTLFAFSWNIVEFEKCYQNKIHIMIFHNLSFFSSIVCAQMKKTSVIPQSFLMSNVTSNVLIQATSKLVPVQDLNFKLGIKIKVWLWPLHWSSFFHKPELSIEEPTQIGHI
jgi:hypothetical protein